VSSHFPRKLCPPHCPLSLPRTRPRAAWLLRIAKEFTSLRFLQLPFSCPRAFYFRGVTRSRPLPFLFFFLEYLTAFFFSGDRSRVDESSLLAHPRRILSFFPHPRSMRAFPPCLRAFGGEGFFCGVGPGCALLSYRVVLFLLPGREEPLFVLFFWMRVRIFFFFRWQGEFFFFF